MAKKRIAHTQTGYTKLDDLTAKFSFLNDPVLMTMTFSHLQVKTSLLNAALACKDLLDIALDKLWETLDSLLPILKLLPALQFENDAYVCANVHVFLYDPILVFRFLVEMYLRQIGIDCNIILEGSGISKSCMILRFILRHMFELLNFSHLLSFHFFVTSTAI